MSAENKRQIVERVYRAWMARPQLDLVDLLDHAIGGSRPSDLSDSELCAKMEKAPNAKAADCDPLEYDFDCGFESD